MTYFYLAAVLLKQFVKKHWQEGEEAFEHPTVSSDEKVYMIIHQCSSNLCVFLAFIHLVFFIFKSCTFQHLGHDVSITDHEVSITNFLSVNSQGQLLCTHIWNYNKISSKFRIES